MMLNSPLGLYSIVISWVHKVKHLQEHNGNMWKSTSVSVKYQKQIQPRSWLTQRLFIHYADDKQLKLTAQEVHVCQQNHLRTIELWTHRSKHHNCSTFQ